MSRSATALGAVAIVAICAITVGCGPRAEDGSAEGPVDAPAASQPAVGTPMAPGGTQTDAVSEDDTRRIAAEFLGCKPDDLRLAAKQPEPKTYWWGRIEEVAWTGHCAVAGFPAADVEISVDRVGAYVKEVEWHPGGTGSAPRSITADQAAALAFTVFRECARLPIERGSIEVLTPGPVAGAYSFCKVAGSYPDGRRFGAFLDLQRGMPGGYRCSVTPADPPATSPVRVTEAEAMKAVEAKVLARGDTPIQTKVLRLGTATAYADRGVPVYQVELTAHIGKAATGRDEAMMPVFADIWAVNATTGEVITKPRGQAQPETNTAPPPPAK